MAAKDPDKPNTMSGLIRKWNSYAKGTMALGCKREYLPDKKRRQPLLRARADTMRQFVTDLRRLERGARNV